MINRGFAIAFWLEAIVFCLFTIVNDEEAIAFWLFTIAFRLEAIASWRFTIASWLKAIAFWSFALTFSAFERFFFEIFGGGFIMFSLQNV